MILSRRFALLTLATALCGWLGWTAFASFQQLRARAASTSNCESDGLCGWRWVLQEYAAAHGGRFPPASKRAALEARGRTGGRSFALRCDTGAPYVVALPSTKPDPRRPEPIVWCGKPHGFTERWRNVLYSDFAIRRVPEAEFVGGRPAGAR
jgi:hypothetical protein